MKHAWWPCLAAGTCICMNSDARGHRYWAGPIVGANALLGADSIHAQDFGGKLWPGIMSNRSSEYPYRWRGRFGLQTQWGEKGRLLTTCQFSRWANDGHEPASWVSLHSDARASGLENRQKQQLLFVYFEWSSLESDSESPFLLVKSLPAFIALILPNQWAEVLSVGIDVKEECVAWVEKGTVTRARGPGL